MTDTISRVSVLVENGYEDRFSAICDALEATKDLPQELKDKVLALGNTPISEPKIFEVIQKSEEEGKASVALAILTEKEILSYPADIVGAFVYAVEQRIMAIKDEDGLFKSTPATANCKLPNFIQVDKLRRLMLKRDEAMKGFAEKKPKAIEAVQAIIEEIAAYTMEVSGLDKDSLTEWEAMLVTAQVIGTANDAFMCTTGKPLKN